MQSYKVVRLMPRPSTIAGYIRNVKRCDVPAEWSDTQALEFAGTDLGSRMVWNAATRTRQRERIADVSARALIAEGDYSITLETR